MRLIEALRRPVVRDAGLALLLAAVSAGWTGRPDLELAAKAHTTLDLTGIWNGRMTWWWIAALPAVAALLIRRRRPATALVLASFAGAVHLLIRDIGILPLDLATVITIYGLASVTERRRRGAVALAGVAAATYLVLLAAAAGYRPPTLMELVKEEARPELPWTALMANALTDAIGPILLLGIAWAIGDNARTRRIHLSTLEQRAADLQRERDHRAALAVASERARITRELHDVVAHGISVMVVQAQGAAAALRNHPDRTAVALDNVIDTGRASLAEMRRLLGIARRDPAADDTLAPQPGIGALAALIDQVRDAGTPVTLVVEGEPVPLPAVVDLSAYRIIQETLTNTIKHAGPQATATVRLAFRPDTVELEVADDGVGADQPSTSDGNGLRGIAERVKVLGGFVEANPRPGGGFRVRVLLPLRAER